MRWLRSLLGGLLGLFWGRVGVLNWHGGAGMDRWRLAIHPLYVRAEVCSEGVGVVEESSLPVHGYDLDFTGFTHGAEA